MRSQTGDLFRVRRPNVKPVEVIELRHLRGVSMTTLGPTSMNSDVMSGALVFSGTRIPIRSLFDYLEGGESLGDFLREFPTVQKSQVIAVLETAYARVAEHATAA
jgi:uncharacterized protein (DUF433 family)